MQFLMAIGSTKSNSTATAPWRCAAADSSTILITLSLVAPAMSIELFRYRGAAKDGGTLEYVFEAGEQNSPNAVTKEKAAEIAADFMTTFYHVQVGALETQEFRTTEQLRFRSGLFASRTRSRGHCVKCFS